MRTKFNKTNNFKDKNIDRRAIARIDKGQTKTKADFDEN